MDTPKKIVLGAGGALVGTFLILKHVMGKGVPSEEPEDPESPYDIDLIDGYISSKNRVVLTLRNNRVDTRLHPNDLEDGALYWVFSFDCYYVLTKPRGGLMEVHTNYGSADIRLPEMGQVQVVTFSWPGGGSDNWGNFAQNLVSGGYIPGRYSFTGHIWIHGSESSRNKAVCEVLYPGGHYGGGSTDRKLITVNPAGLIVGRR
jgi:hypothetical protein